jgi:hypothetical protein
MDRGGERHLWSQKYNDKVLLIGPTIGQQCLPLIKGQVRTMANVFCKARGTYIVNTLPGCHEPCVIVEYGGII